MSRGLFITFEGPDGSGKSTQAALLSERLKEEGRTVLLTREPGGTAISEKIRGLLLDPANSAMGARTEALLYAASRAQLVCEVIRPALEEGCIVICDRYIDSSVAYQGWARSLGPDEIRTINSFGTQGLSPDITFFLDLDPVEGLRRAACGRGSLDRMEREKTAFHLAVYNGYLDTASKEKDRIVMIDASRSVQEISFDIWKHIENYVDHI